MRRLRGCAVAIPILLLATACDEQIPGAEKTVTAAEAARVEVAEPLATTSTGIAVSAPPTTAPGVGP